MFIQVVAQLCGQYKVHDFSYLHWRIILCDEACKNGIFHNFDHSWIADRDAECRSALERQSAQNEMENRFISDSIRSASVSMSSDAD
jgi:hypothetical protein